MRHLVIGASGQVGSALWRHLTAQGETVTGTYTTHPRSQMVAVDMRNAEAIQRLVTSIRPDVIWIPGAMPDVDRCELDPDLSYAVNVQGPATVLNEARAIGAQLVYFSSDYVFDGMDGPYGENDIPHPLQVYGQHKLDAEEILLRYSGTLIVRPAWIYSDEPNPRNFVFRVIDDLKEGRAIKSAADQYNTPTPAAPLVRMAVKALLNGYRGVLHLAGPERMTRLALVEEIAGFLGYPKSSIEAIRVSQLTLPARRPLNGGLLTQFPRYRITERLQDLDFRSLITQS